MKTTTNKFSVNLNDVPVEAEVEYIYEKYYPARITADPYFSSPAEGGYSEIHRVWIVLTDTSGNEVKVDVADYFQDDDNDLQQQIFEYEESEKEAMNADRIYDERKEHL